jgi:uncharacterized protein (TIGR02145 family)
MRTLFTILLITMYSLTHSQELKGIKIGNSIWTAENLKIKIPDSYSYNNDKNNDPLYGRLYTWEAALNACPAGWHLPTEKEWNDLIAFLGGSETGGKHLKTGGSSGFNAVFAGFSNIAGYMMQGHFGTFWTASEFDSDHAWYVYVKSKDNSVTKTYFTKSYKLSVRCVKN